MYVGPRFPLASSGVVYSDPRWGSGSAETYMIDPERTRSLVCNYQKFCPSDRRAIDTALARLAQAWGGWYREERAIDLGIALESALMGGPGIPSNNKSEITYKLGVRAAWLIGADSKERKEVFQKIRQLYDFRSNAAHLGEVKTKPDTWQQVDEKIEAGIVLAGRIVAAILARAEWPNWDDLVLGGAQP